MEFKSIVKKQKYYNGFYTAVLLQNYAIYANSADYYYR